MSAPEAIVTWRGPVAEGAKPNLKRPPFSNKKSRVHKDPPPRVYCRPDPGGQARGFSFCTRRGIVKRVTRYCRWRQNALMLCMERRDRNELDKLSGLSCFEKPALQAPVGAGLSVWFRGHFAVAL